MQQLYRQDAKTAKEIEMALDLLRT